MDIHCSIIIFSGYELLEKVSAVSLSLFLSVLLCLYLSRCFCVSLFLNLYFFLFLSRSYSLSPSPTAPISFSLSLSQPLSVVKLSSDGVQLPPKVHHRGWTFLWLGLIQVLFRQSQFYLCATALLYREDTFVIDIPVL